MAEAWEGRMARLEALMDTVLRQWARQGAVEDDLREWLRRQDRLNVRLTTAIERIEAVLARLVPGGGNGREA
jgi:hypothetical protein